MTKVTKEDYALFKRECQRWTRLLGLSSWTVSYRKKKLRGNNAECWANMEGGIALICLNTIIDARRDIPLHAHHEVRELQLWPVRETLSKMGLSDEAINTQLHIIINQEEACMIACGLLPNLEKEKTE
jgi:hypothetical protein